MFEIILNSLNIVLITYALVNILSNIYTALTNKRCVKKEYFVVINIKNNQKQIEGIIRSIIWKSLSESGGGFIPNILIVDKGATNDTLIIIDKLINEYEFIYYVTEENFEKMKINIQTRG